MDDQDNHISVFAAPINYLIQLTNHLIQIRVLSSSFDLLIVLLPVFFKLIYHVLYLTNYFTLLLRFLPAFDWSYFIV